MHSFILALFLTPWFIPSVQATPAEFLADKYRGWFFREPDAEPDAEHEATAADKDKNPPFPSAEAQDIRPFSQAWFSKNLPRLRDHAIDNPTKQNVMAYLTVQKLWTDAASNFSTTFSSVVMENPWLTDEKFRPTASVGAQFYESRAATARSDLLKRLADKTGIWFFFASYCDYCHAQAPVLRDMRDRLGLQVLAISLDGKGLPDFPRFQPDRGQAQKYNVTSTPTLLIYRENKLYPLAEGILSSEQIVDRLLYYAKEYGWISEKDWNRAQPVDYKGILPASFMATLSADDANNPRLLMDKVKTQLLKQNLP